MTATRAGFVALVGAPNAGKSTLLNAVVGMKLAIVSSKVQTTRTRMLGIVTDGQTQMIFIDTPGIFEPKKRLDRAMVAAAWTGAEDADLAAVLVDASLKRPLDAPQRILERLAPTGRTLVAVLTKIDLVRPEALLPLAQTLNDTAPLAAIYMVSAKTGSGIDSFRQDLASRLPEGPWLYPEDEPTDMPMRLLAAELTREQVFEQLRDELPYATTVETEGWEEFADGSVRITQVITVERDGQKAIVIGKGGERIRSIGQQARLAMEEVAQRRVHLGLFVRVRDSWQDDPEQYRLWGLDYDA